MRHVDLCSGIGGFSLGFEWAGLSKPVLFCDVEPWCRRVLSKHWPDVPVASDVKELANDPDGLVPDCDILTAGYPCQPFSLAGERRGTEDDRHIWPYILSIVKAKRPAWCVFENVYGHVSMGLDEVLSDLEGEGYAARPFIVPACAADAPHRRDRVWIVAKDMAHAESKQRHERHDDKRNEASAEEGIRGEARASCSNVAYTQRKRQQGQRPQGNASNQEANGEGQAAQSFNGSIGNFWLPEPAVGRVANGIPRRVDRLKGLGNAIVPQIAMRIGQTIKAVADQ
jgi:DNA (cytosine-5)-methyltransferase 1